MKRIVVELEDKEYEEIKIKSFKLDTSVRAIVRSLLAVWVKKEDKKKG